MSRLCVDTSAYSQFRRGHLDAVSTIRRARWVGIPVVVLGELRAGFLAGRQRERNELELRAFLAEPVVQVVDVDADSAEHYGAIVDALRRAGTPVPTNDVWIAACAARTGSQVLTFDNHFRCIERVGTVLLSARA